MASAAHRGALLERVALHQTRLRTPGLALDPSGVALGSHGLVLLPTIERLVAFLSIYTRERSLADFVGGHGASGGDDLEVWVATSPLGTRELVLLLPAGGPTFLDVVADVARLSSGLAFTGTGRYFVQYRDRQAPFGYDAVELLRVEGDGDLALHHSSFTQVYRRERRLDLAGLMARLEPRPDPSSTPLSTKPLWVLAEPGVASSLIGYLARSGVEAEAGVLELPAASSFDDTPRRRTLFRIADLPPRLLQLVAHTPGITAYLPAGVGVAVQAGFRHPVHLTGLPVFPPEGIALLPGPARDTPREPILAARLPQLGPVTSLVDVRLSGQPVTASIAGPSPNLALPLRLAPSGGATRQVVASLLPISMAPLLRRLAYALPTSGLEAATIARLRGPSGGADLLAIRIGTGVDAVPLGTFFSERAPGLLVMAGHDLVPACSPSHLARAAGASGQRYVFVYREPGDHADVVRTLAIDASAFSPLSEALVTPESWGALMPAEVVELSRSELSQKLGEVSMEPLGLLPMRGV